MRFGLDIAQQRMDFGEVVARARFAEDLGFDGAWGFDHFQPMYGSGPGECFEGYTTLAALSGRNMRPVVSRVRLPPLFSRVIVPENSSNRLVTSWIGEPPRLPINLNSPATMRMPCDVAPSPEVLRVLEKMSGKRLVLASTVLSRTSAPPRSRWRKSPRNSTSRCAASARSTMPCAKWRDRILRVGRGGMKSPMTFSESG